MKNADLFSFFWAIPLFSVIWNSIFQMYDTQASVVTVKKRDATVPLSRSIDPIPPSPVSHIAWDDACSINNNANMNGRDDMGIDLHFQVN